MTMTNPSRDAVVPPANAAAVERPYVEWAPIIAGATVATTIALALTTFGSALGLAMTSPYPQSGASGRAVAIAAAIYTLWVLSSAWLVGGYLAGRLRHRTFDSTQHESEVRNGAHGLVVWALAALLVGTIGSFALGSSSRGTLITSGASETPDLVNRAADSLLRSERGVPNEGLRRQVTPLLEKTATGKDLAPDEKAFVSRVTAAQTGVTTADADKRVDATVTALRDDVNAARKLGVLVAFVTAAALAIGAAAAWWGATLGGKHRDEGTRVGFLHGF